MGEVRSNFCALFRERGKVVPGSRREGHNVFTDYGRLWLPQLLSWQDITTVDIPFTNYRLRWLALGSGSLPETPSIVSLQNGALINGSSYLWPLTSAGFSFPTVSSMRIVSSLAEGDAVAGNLINEAGLLVDGFPQPSGAAASIVEQGGVVTVSGLSGMTPLSVGRFLHITNGDNPSWYRILSYLDETSVIIDSPYLGVDSGNPNITWTEVLYSTDSGAPVVAYKSFESMIKLSSFELEVRWELKF